MHTGKQLGKAIEQAISLKIATGAVRHKKNIALHFGIKPPSLYTWINEGSIGKEKVPSLISYFSDVVDLRHWGIDPSFAQTDKARPHEAEQIADSLSPEQLTVWLEIGRMLAVNRSNP